MAREHYWPTGSKTAQDQEKRALAAEHDRQVRHRSVANDIRLDLPVSVARPDGEEYPARQRLRSHDKRYEIQKPYIQGPPNKTVWDSRDCLERTVTQPSSSSSSRSGGSKSTSKSSSSHWGLSWSRSNKSPPSQGRSSRGQQRHPHVSNPSTSVRNAPSSCETARGNSGGGGAAGNGGLLASPSLHSSFMPLSSSTLGSIPNSSLIGFHGAATVAGDNSAFPNHNQSSFSSHQSTPNTTSCKQQQHHHHHHHNQPVLFPGGGAITPSPSIAERLSEKVQQCTNVIVGNQTRTSPNNNSGCSTTPTQQQQQSTSSVLSRLIDPDAKLFSRNSSKDSKRSNNNNHGKNGKSHRTEQSSSASSSPGGSSPSLVECSSAHASGTTPPHQILHNEQLQQQQHSYFQESRNSQQSQNIPVPRHLHHHHPHPQQFMQAAMQEATSSSSCSVPVTNPFLSCYDPGKEEDDEMMVKRSNNRVVMPILRSKTPDNNNPSCSLSGGSRTSSERSGPRSFDAYCGADAGAIHKSCSDSKAGSLVANITDPTQFHVPSTSSSLVKPHEPGSPSSVSMSDSENGSKCSSPRDKNSIDESKERVPPVVEAATVQSLKSQGHCGPSDTNTLQLSQSSSSSFPRPAKSDGGGDDSSSVVIGKDQEMKGFGGSVMERLQQQQQQPQDPYKNPHSPSPSIISSNVSFNNSQTVHHQHHQPYHHHLHQMSASVPSNPSLLSPPFNFNNAAALLPTNNCNLPPSTSPHAAIAATASFAAAESDLPLSRCSEIEKKRGDVDKCTLSSSGCSTDPNYSTFANDKITDNNNCCTPPSPNPCSSSTSSSRENKSHLQSQPERYNNDDSRMIVTDNNNFNADCSSSFHHHHHEFIVADHDDEQMISESTASCATTVITNANKVKDKKESGESNSSPSSSSLVDRETAHHCELSVIASKNDTTTTSSFDQYCNAASAELTTRATTSSLHSSPSSNNSPSPTSSSSALSLPSSSTATSSNNNNHHLPLEPSSSSAVASHHHHQQKEQRHHQHHHQLNVVLEDKYDYDMQNQ